MIRSRLSLNFLDRMGTGAPIDTICSITMQDKSINKLEQFIHQQARNCVHTPDGLLRYPFVTPTYGIRPGADDQSIVSDRSKSGHYLQMYDWDACFFSQAASRAGIQGLAHSIVDNYLSLRESDGYVPRTISPHHIWDRGDICKPFLAQALLHEIRLAPGKKTQLEFLPDLADYLLYFEHKRKDKTGLYRWRNVLESGVDDNLALIYPTEAAKDTNTLAGEFLESRIVACDLSTYLVAEYRAFANLLEISDCRDTARTYYEHADKLSSLINDLLWNGELGLYCNLDPDTGKQIEIRTWTGLMPVLFDIAKPNQIDQVVHTSILNEKQFLRPCGISSTACSEPLYNQAARGLYGRVIVSNWQGPMWILPNVLTVRCLIKHGFKSQAKDLSMRVVSTMINGLEETGTTYENYDAETGKPLWAPQFISWNILALELIELLKS